MGDDTLTTDNLSAAVAKGLREAISDPEFWRSASIALQQQAKAEAGGWLLGGLKLFLSRVMWILVIGLGVYMLGGWSALVALVKATAHP